MPTILVESLSTKREVLFRELRKDPAFKSLFRDDHPFLNFQLLDITEETVTYRVGFRSQILPHRVTISSFLPDYFAFSMGQEAAIKHFSIHFYKGLFALFVNEVGESVEDELEKLQVVIDGQIDWKQFEILVDLLTRNFVTGGLLTVGVKQDEVQYSIGFKSASDKIQMRPLILTYEKAMLSSDFAFVGKNVSNEEANEGLKNLLALDFVRALYKDVVRG